MSQTSTAYVLKFTAIINNQSVDATPYVTSFNINHSIDNIEPLFSISISTQFLIQTNYQMQYLEVSIQSQLFTGESISQETFVLMPLDYEIQNAMFENNNYPDTTIQTFGFKSMNCFNILSSSIKGSSFFQTTLTNILNSIKPNNCNLITTPNAPTDSIEQVFLPTQSFMGAIDYIDKNFGFYQGATSITAYPDTSSIQSKICRVSIRDVAYMSSKSLYDFEVIAAYPFSTAETATKQMLSAVNSKIPTFVLNTMPQYYSKAPQILSLGLPSAINTPLKSISSNLNNSLVDFINKYSFVDNSFNLSKENSQYAAAQSTQNMYGYHGWDTSFNVLTSHMGLRLSYISNILFSIDLPPKISSIYAGQVLKLTINDVHTSQYSGLYLVNNVKVNLLSSSTGTWTGAVTIHGVRSNTISN